MAWIKFNNGGPWSCKPIFIVESLEHPWRESVKVFWTSPVIASLIFLALDLVIGPSGTSNGSWISWAIGSAPWFSSQVLEVDFKKVNDENEGAQPMAQDIQDPLEVPKGPITRSRAKKIKDAMNGLVQKTLTDSRHGCSSDSTMKIGLKGSSHILWHLAHLVMY